ncbi:hypothetical protein VNO77_04136 [Canavalia gladiata]|uniref:Uncharacterized protein n=1 Tax=Canavalia gladiata TaxID=3824 RepID=A0AAN9N149_CANGL
MCHTREHVNHEYWDYCSYYCTCCGDIGSIIQFSFFFSKHLFSCMHRISEGVRGTLPSSLLLPTLGHYMKRELDSWGWRSIGSYSCSSLFSGSS